jgi:hypothetical protein
MRRQLTDREWTRSVTVIRKLRSNTPWQCPSCKDKVPDARYAPFCVKCQRHMEPR